MGLALTASFIFHILTSFILLLLWMRLSSVSKELKQQERMQSEIEGVLSSYIMEMKDENEKLLSAIQNGVIKQSKTPSASIASPSSSISSMNVKPSSKTVYRAYHSSQNAAEKPQSPPILSEKDMLLTPLSKGNEQYVQSLASKAIELEKKGYTIEEIAKELNKGKTEIELILKFRSES
ncbi:hypothetical protein [Bacillus solimangrovi]|uniref:Swarming motility protein SwrB n=1 Tax=Bacillus solimangrovi TaxID=1305675 RepID=A0A1E5LB35_9BACI|nr:hypothetical protein [Bacillus solimangrovi]OEH91288.1 hypothetical protein BFG57_06630 [Bacillus solimangrovi]